MNKWFSIFAVIICSSLLFFGCNFKLFGGSSEEDICKKKPPEARSWLCEAAAAAGVTLNEVDSLLLDGSAVAVVVADIGLPKVEKFLNKAEDCLDLIDIEKLTYRLLIRKMKLEATEAKLLQNIFARHIEIFESDEPVTSWDQYLIRLEIRRQKDQFGLTYGSPEGGLLPPAGVQKGVQSAGCTPFFQLKEARRI